jgi:hypothetical protein
LTLTFIQSSRRKGKTPSRMQRKSRGAWLKVSRKLMSGKPLYFSFSLPRNTRCIAHSR